MPRYAYHWTTRAAILSIKSGGLDPAYATGKRACVWVGSRERLLWACAHAAMHQRCNPDEMVLVRVDVQGLRLNRTAWRGVRICSTVIPPSRLSVCRDVLTQKWVPIQRVRSKA